MNNLTFANGQTVLGFLSEKLMELEILGNLSQFKVSQQMRALLLIFQADVYLMEAVMPFVNVETETIAWDKILKLGVCSGHKAAIRWAYGVWTDEMPYGNCFDGALNMSPQLQVAVLEALCLRWGLRG